MADVGLSLIRCLGQIGVIFPLPNGCFVSGYYTLYAPQRNVTGMKILFDESTKDMNRGIF